MTTLFSISHRIGLAATWMAAVCVAGCALERSPLVDRRSDGGGLDAPIAPLDGDLPADDVPIGQPDVPAGDDAPRNLCMPECAPGQVCIDGACACDAAACGDLGGECRDVECQPCGSLEAACCTTREPCTGGAVCGTSDRCVISSECGQFGQPCCGGRTCDGSMVCLGGVCEDDAGSCGGDDEPCCEPSSRCLDRLSCRRTALDSRRLCRSCGERFSACCTVGPACNNGADCFLGGCP
jgi:hypothetical protein